MLVKEIANIVACLLSEFARPKSCRLLRVLAKRFPLHKSKWTHGGLAAALRPNSTIAIRAPVPEHQLLNGLIGGLVGSTCAVAATMVQPLNGSLTHLLHPKPKNSLKNTDDVFSYV